MKKNDARVRYTKLVLKNALLKLMQTKPINKITVKEVCELAGLNRATFYAHYGNCFDLLESIEQEILDAFNESLKLIDSFDVSSLIEAIYKIIEENENACRILIFNAASSRLIHSMISLAHKESIEYWKMILNNATDNQLDMLYIHLSNGLMHVVIECYGKYGKHDIIEFVNSMVKTSLSTFK